MLVGKVVRYGEIGNAVCWNYMTEVVIRLRWLYHPNQMKAMTEIENMGDFEADTFKRTGKEQ